MAFKEDYKDEIADRKYQLIDDRTGAVIYPEVKMERVDTPSQVGDKFGANNTNEIYRRLNEIENGESVVKKSDLQRTVDRNNVWYDDRLFYVQEITNGIYQPYVQEPDRICEVMSKYADISNDTLKLGGYRVLDQIVVVNPAGNAHAYVHCGGKAVYYANVINGNWGVCKAHIKDIAYDGNLIIFFDTAFNANIQLNLQMFYKE